MGPATADAPPATTRWRYRLGDAKGDLPAPPGYAPADAVAVPESEAQLSSKQKSKAEWMQQRAMAVGMGPGRGLPMQAFMMWMSGSGVNIFSMMITGMALVNPIKAMASIDDTFKRFENHEPPVDLTLPKLAFVACNCAMLAVALWKLNTMGLLPITAADWTSFLVDKVHVEASGVPVPL
mmetsp:Transcript_6230/g.18434  ORF Transcript_6230/g.18434 Transcript_6230/m.18434 type:complete len:180 (-) Transcript_6230:35-574(-)